jgi:hypothetical protein
MKSKLILWDSVHLRPAAAPSMFSSVLLGIVVLDLERFQFGGGGPVMVKIRLQTTHNVSLSTRSLGFGKGTLDGHIGGSNQDKAEQCNKNNSGSRFRHGMYTPCQAICLSNLTQLDPPATRLNYTQVYPIYN